MHNVGFRRWLTLDDVCRKVFDPLQAALEPNSSHLEHVSRNMLTPFTVIFTVMFLSSNVTQSGCDDPSCVKSDDWPQFKQQLNPIFFIKMQHVSS